MYDVVGRIYPHNTIPHIFILALNMVKKNILKISIRKKWFRN